MRFVIGLIVAGLIFEAVPVEAVALVIGGLTWIGLSIYSPPYCPHCRKKVMVLANTCSHCGKAVKEEAAD